MNNCLVCNSLLTYQSKYCSRECYYKSRIGKATWNKGLKGEGYSYKGTIIKNNCRCLICGKEFHYKPSALKRKGRGNYCSIICRGKAQSIRMNGIRDKKYGMPLEKNPNWKGGLSFIEYPLGWNLTFKEQIRNRDGYKCQVCGMPECENTRRLDIHHKDYNKLNLKPDNLISLCMRCHRKTNFNREYWVKFFSKEVMPNALAR